MKKKLLAAVMICSMFAISMPLYAADVKDMSLEELQAAYEQLQNNYDELQQKYNEIAPADEPAAETTTPPPTAAADDFVSQLEISEYSLDNSIGDTYYLLIIKNNSPYTLSISSNATAKDASGNLIGATSASEDAVESGFETCLLNYFDGVPQDSKFEYTLTAEQDDYYTPVLSDLQYEVSQTPEKAIVSCTNIGDEPASFVEGQALFFNAGTLIRVDSTYFTDDDSEIKPGATIIKELNSYDVFDEVKLYFSGRR